jgi:hypothetical protein
MDFVAMSALDNGRPTVAADTTGLIFVVPVSQMYGLRKVGGEKNT